MACNINPIKTDETEQSHQLYYRGFHSRSSRGKQGSVRKQSKQQHHLIPRKWLLPIRFFTIRTPWLFCSATALYVQATNCCRQNDRHAWATQWSNHAAESKISKPFFHKIDLCAISANVNNYFWLFVIHSFTPFMFLWFCTWNISLR